MKEVLIAAGGDYSYPIHIEEDFSMLKDSFFNSKIRLDKAFIITDRNVAALYYEKVLNELKDVFTHISGIIDIEGEKDKNIKTIKEVYFYFNRAGLDRCSTVIALGGGVLSDIAGYAASTWKRGTNLVQIPTTLIAQSDAAIGGKNGINYKSEKNLIGTFYNPKMVYINSSLVNTLPDAEFNAGMAEVIKYGIVCDKSLFDYISDNRDKIKRRDQSAVKHIIAESCRCKVDLVSEDEKDFGVRRILNFGHTFGHAIEAETGKRMFAKQRFSHGKAVAAGMVAAAYLSLERGYISRHDLNNIIDLLSFFSLPIKCPGGIMPDKLYKHMLNDKKNRNSRINLILVKNFGEGFAAEDCSKEEVMGAISKIL